MSTDAAERFVPHGEAESETLDVGASDAGHGRDDALSASQMKRKCSRCGALVRSDARACPECRLEFPWMSMDEYYAEGGHAK